MHDDSGYELNDPKHPTFHDRYADIWDNRDKTVEKGRQMAKPPRVVEPQESTDEIPKCPLGCKQEPDGSHSLSCPTRWYT